MPRTVGEIEVGAYDKNGIDPKRKGERQSSRLCLLDSRVHDRGRHICGSISTRGFADPRRAHRRYLACAAASWVWRD